MPICTSPPRKLETLLARCIERAESPGEQGLAALLDEHPDQAPELGRHLDALRGMGLIRESSAAAEPHMFGDFRILSRLGEGGMGVVWLARQLSVDRLVALKLLHPFLAASSTSRTRFRREARALAALRHPHVVGVIGAGERDGQLWLAMEYVPGVNLDQRLQQEGEQEATLVQKIGWAAQIARALGAAHAAGIVHRDVKPSNVRIDEAQRALLFDFGLARDTAAQTFTISGSFQGTPLFASPEQLEGRVSAIGPASDVYSLGATLYESLTGRPPREGRSSMEILQRLHSQTLQPLHRAAPGVPSDLEHVVSKALELQPEERYTNGDALAEDFEAVLAFRPIAARPPGLRRRARRWFRGHRALATGATLVGVGLLAVVLATAAERYSARAERQQQALRLVTQARTGLSSHVVQADGDHQLEADLARRENELHEDYAPADEWRALDRDQARARERREARALLFAEVQRWLDQAQRLAPGLEAVNEVRADLHAEQLRLARAARDTNEARYQEARLEAVDTHGRHADFLAGLSPCSISTTPAGAELSLYRYLEADELGVEGGSRLVAVPWGGFPEGIEPGQLVFRVAAASGELERGDHITSVAGHPLDGSVLVADGNHWAQRGDRLIAVDGQPVLRRLHLQRFTAGSGPFVFLFSHAGEEYSVEAASLAELELTLDDALPVASAGGLEARVWRNGEVFETTLQAGLLLRPTASPLWICAEAFQGRTPCEALSLPTGSYVALLRAPGHADLRLPFDIEHGVALELEVTLPRGRGPGPDWVPVLSQESDGREAFWVLDHEVSCAEYLRFLNRPENLEAIYRPDAAPTLYPRDTSQLEKGSFFLAQGGAFHPGPYDAPDTPIYGVNALDAEAYAAWLSEEAAALGEEWVFALPTLQESETLRRVSRQRRYATGRHFRPHAIQSAGAKPELRLEPSFSYPLDECPRGLYDLTGGVAEWTGSYLSEDLDRRWMAGGGWAYRQPFQFELDYHYAASEVACYGTQGFRLVARAANAAPKPSPRIGG